MTTTNEEGTVTPVSFSVSLDFAKIPLVIYAATQSVSILAFLVTAVVPQLEALTVFHALLPTIAVVSLVLSPVALIAGLIVLLLGVMLVAGVGCLIVVAVVWIVNFFYELVTSSKWKRWRKDG